MGLEDNINKEHVNIILSQYGSYYASGNPRQGIQRAVSHIGYPDKYSTFLLLSILSEWAMVSSFKEKEFNLLKHAEKPKFEQILNLSLGHIPTVSEDLGNEDKCSDNYIAFVSPIFSDDDHIKIKEIGAGFEQGKTNIRSYIGQLNLYDSLSQDRPKTEFKRALGVAQAWLNFDEPMAALFLDYALLRLSLFNNLGYIDFNEQPNKNSKLRKRVLRIVKRSMNIDENHVYDPLQVWAQSKDTDSTLPVPTDLEEPKLTRGKMRRRIREQEQEIENKEREEKRVQVQKEFVERLPLLLDNLKQRLFGQDENLEIIVDSFEGKDFGTERPDRALSFILVGPTGVGKTETGIAISEELFPDIPPLRIDCTEYVHQSDVSRLLGSAPGYIGYYEGGLIPNFAKKYGGYGAIIFDEIEKAHPAVHNFLLTLTDTDKMTDTQQEVYRVSNLFIIMTSNVGNDSVTLGKNPIGFYADKEANTKRLRRICVNKEFCGPLRGRVPILEFNPLTPEAILQIYEREFDMIKERVSLNKGYFLTINEQAKEAILHECETPEYGGREIRRTLVKYLKPWYRKSRGAAFGTVLTLDYNGKEYEYNISFPQII